MSSTLAPPHPEPAKFLNPTPPHPTRNTLARSSLRSPRRWWKFLSQFAERAILVVIVAFWGGSEGDSFVSLYFSLVVMTSMLLLSSAMKPFQDEEQDTLDRFTRLTNVANVAVGVVAAGDYLGSSTSLMCFIVISESVQPNPHTTVTPNQPTKNANPAPPHPTTTRLARFASLALQASSTQ